MPCEELLCFVRLRSTSLALARAPRSLAATRRVLTMSDGDTLSRENEELKERLQVLERELKESDKQWGYVVVKGLIVDSENVYMETMDVDQAKQYCNAHPECKGFTFGGWVREIEPWSERASAISEAALCPQPGRASRGRSDRDLQGRLEG